MISFVLAWTMSCSQYHGAIQRLYDDPYFQDQHHEARKDIHELFKTKTWPECLESEA